MTGIGPDPQVLLSHWGGNQNVRAVLAALHRERMLGLYSTTLAVAGHDKRAKVLPPSARRELHRRAYDLPKAALSTHPWMEIRHRIRRRLKSDLSTDALISALDHATAQQVATARLPFDAVYCYEDGAWATFASASRRGALKVYDLPISYWAVGRQLMTEEADRLPEWRAALGGGLEDSEEKLARKDVELEAADLVVVPSQFVWDSLPLWARGKAVLTPFGSPRPSTEPVRRAAGGPLRVLFAGSMTQRKGLADLLAATRLLGPTDVELVVMGSHALDLDFYRRFGNFTYEPGRPHDEVLSLMRTCDVFCLPSLFEGRALVMQEAMSQGLPLLITPNTGGTDLVEDGRTGFVVPIRSPEVIAERLAWFADHREETAAMGSNARRHAANFTWDFYGRQVATALRTSLGN